MKYQIEELLFNVEEHGSGEPALVFLHYWGGSSRTWNAVTSQLSTHFRCVAFDQRGWGQSDAPPKGYSIRRSGFRCQERHGSPAFPPSDALREQTLSDNFAGAPQARLAWPTSSAYEDISAVVGNIAVPTLILAGDQDRQDPVEQQEREVLPRISGAQIKVIRNCGHLMPIDQPGEVADSIRSFVSTAASPALKSN